MSKILVSVASELVTYLLGLGVVIILNPTMSLSSAIVVATAVYVFATIVTIIIKFITKILVNMYYTRKEKKK